MMHIDVTVLDERWRGTADLEDLASRAARAALDRAETSADTSTEVSLVFSSDAHVRELNSQYRGKAAPTNVLSFPADARGMAPVTPLGDVILALETIERESADQGKTFENHLCHLIVHGVLHLLGYDHEDDSCALDMEGREIAALAQLGVPNPYE